MKISDYGNQYSEVAVALEDFEYGKLAKFTIPVLMPSLNQKEIINKKIHIASNNIMNTNKDIIGIRNYTSCNYVELHVPRELGEVGNKGDKFIVIFVSGDINKCSIIGRYE